MFKIFDWINWLFGRDTSQDDQNITVDSFIPDFEYMTKREIDEWALEQGIELDGRWSKTRMIDYLKEELHI